MNRYRAYAASGAQAFEEAPRRMVLVEITVWKYPVGRLLLHLKGG